VGIIVCEECGRKLQSKPTQSILAKGNKVIYHYYAHRQATKKECSAHHKMSIIHGKILSTLQEIAGNPKRIELLIKENSRPVNTDDIKEKLERCRDERAKLIDKKGKLLDFYLDGVWEKDELDQKKRDIEIQIAAISSRESELDQRLTSSLRTDVDIKKVSEALLMLKGFNENKELTDDQKITLIRDLISEVRVSKLGAIELFLKVNVGSNACPIISSDLHLCLTLD